MLKAELVSNYRLNLQYQMNTSRFTHYKHILEQCFFHQLQQWKLKKIIRNR